MKKSIKTGKQLERHFKGAANYRRIEILLLLAREDGLSLDGITERLKGNEKTISEHTRKLVLAGLVNKSYQGRSVAHSLSPYGKLFCHFIQSLQ